MVIMGEAPRGEAMRLAERLRDRLPALRLQLNSGGGSFKSQFKRADRSGARYALIVAEEELAEGRVGLKDLRGEGDQVRLDEDALVGQLAAVATRRDDINGGG